MLVQAASYEAFMKSHGLDPGEAHRDFIRSQAADAMKGTESMTPEELETYLKTLDPEATSRYLQSIRCPQHGGLYRGVLVAGASRS